MADTRRFAVETAGEAAGRNELGAWVAEFLSSPGSDNAELAEDLTNRIRHWLGPVRVPIRDLHRLAGPPEHPVLCAVDDDEWRDDVEEMSEEIEEGWEPPPLIVSFREGKLVLEDGNHRVEGLRRADRRTGWAVIGFDEPEDRDTFVAIYGAGKRRGP